MAILIHKSVSRVSKAAEAAVAWPLGMLRRVCRKLRLCGGPSMLLCHICCVLIWPLRDRECDEDCGPAATTCAQTVICPCWTFG